jgi:hypothetical protein
LVVTALLYQTAVSEDDDAFGVPDRFYVGLGVSDEEKGYTPSSSPTKVSHSLRVMSAEEQETRIYSLFDEFRDAATQER